MTTLSTHIKETGKVLALSILILLVSQWFSQMWMMRSSGDQVAFTQQTWVSHKKSNKVNVVFITDAEDSKAENDALALNLYPMLCNICNTFFLFNVNFTYQDKQYADHRLTYGCISDTLYLLFRNIKIFNFS